MQNTFYIIKIRTMNISNLVRLLVISISILGCPMLLDAEYLNLYTASENWEINKNNIHGVSKDKLPSLLLQNVQYVDVNNGILVKDKDILIENGIITRIEDSGILKGDEGIPVRDMSGKYLMPGLIDAHIHLFQSGGLYTRPDAINLTGVRSYEEERDNIAQNITKLMHRYLKFGITSLVDVGGPMSNYDYRDKFRDNLNMPNLFVTGPLVSTYQPAAFAIEDPPIIKVENEEEALELVRAQAKRNPDFIKIWYINLPYLSADSTFPMMQAVVAESHSLGMPVAIHATELQTAKLAIKAGGDYLVHSVSEPIDKEFIDLCLENDVVLSPSLKVSSNYDLAFSGKIQPSPMDFEAADPFVLGTLFDANHLQNHPSLKQYNRNASFWAKRNSARDSVQQINFRRLMNAGVKIATGTDAGNIGTLHTASYFAELEIMSASGMSNAAVLKSSTTLAAEAAGKQDMVGSIEVGKMGDILVMESNPLIDLNALRDIDNIVKSGSWVEPDTILASTPEELAQQQLNAYNARNLEAFLKPYAEDVRIYTFQDKLDNEGKDAMRKIYGPMFERATDLHCKLVNRIVQGNTVIDQEEVIFEKGRDPLHAIAIYKIENGKIQEVYFIQ